MSFNFSNANTIGGIVLAVLGAVAVLAITTFLVTRPSQVDQMAQRLSHYAGGGVDGATVDASGKPAGVRDLFDRFTTTLNPILDRTSHTGQLADDLQKADLRMKASEWVLGVFGVAIIVGLLVAVRFGSILIGVLGGAVIYLLAGFYLKFRQRRRIRAFNKQLGETILLLSNALKAGYSFAQALATVSQGARPPIGEEFARATREIQLGISVDEALNHMVERNESEDFDLLITAVQIQRVVGGNLAEILDTIAFTIRERVRIQGEIRTLTAQARFSGYIIALLPIGLGLFLAFVEPSYFTPMLTTTLGKVLLAFGGVMMVIGIAIIQKMVKIEV